MSRWTHAQCDACWNERNSDRPADPTPRNDVMVDQCCWCGRPTRGIYVREDPTMVACGGSSGWVHEDGK